MSQHDEIGYWEAAVTREHFLGSLGVPSEFGQQSTLRKKHVNSINNLQEQTLQTARKRSVTVSGLYSVFIDR